MNSEIPTQVTIGEMLGHGAAVVDPLDFSYFATLEEDEWGRSKSLARRATAALAGGPYSEYIKSHGPVEKAGEFLFKGFLEYYCWASYDVNSAFGTRMNQVDMFVPGFGVSGRSIDVHTRMLRRGQDPPSCYPLVNTRRFQLMVPEIGLSRRADVYVFCGFDVDSRFGCAFGWISADELADVPVSDSLRYRAKCINVYDAHPISTLLEYLG
jgi:hypothetical protein